MEEVCRTFVFLIKKNCYVSASAHLTQQFSCINNVKVNRYIRYCQKQFIRQSLLLLHKLCKHRRTYNSQKTGNCDHELAIPAAKAKALKDGGYVGKTVVLGIRPEDIHDSQMFIEASPSAPMTSVVKVYELLGAEVFLYFDVNGTQVTARVDPRTTAKTGDPIKFAFDMEKSHFFDKETELTICN